MKEVSMTDVLTPAPMYAGMKKLEAGACMRAPEATEAMNESEKTEEAAYEKEEVNETEEVAACKEVDEDKSLLEKMTEEMTEKNVNTKVNSWEEESREDESQAVEMEAREDTEPVVNREKQAQKIIDWREVCGLDKEQQKTMFIEASAVEEVCPSDDDKSLLCGSEEDAEFDSGTQAKFANKVKWTTWKKPDPNWWNQVHRVEVQREDVETSITSRYALGVCPSTEEKGSDDLAEENG
jgi:hypothetical protein